jgi:hypothetical protein
MRDGTTQALIVLSHSARRRLPRRDSDGDLMLQPGVGVNSSPVMAGAYVRVLPAFTRAGGASRWLLPASGLTAAGG